MKVLITGANGFLATRLIVDMELTKVYDLFFLVNINVNNLLRFKNDSKKIHKYVNYFELKKWVHSINPDAIIHLASIQHYIQSDETLEEMINTNIKLGIELLEVISQIDCSIFINLSTYFKYYDSTEYNPVNFYAASKKAFEDIMIFYVENYCKTGITLDIYDIFGENDSRNKLYKLVLDSLDSKSSLGITPGEQLLDLVYIGDITRAIIMILESEKLQVEGYFEYSLSSERQITVKTMIQTIENKSGLTANVLYGDIPYRNRVVMKPVVRNLKLPGWTVEVIFEEWISNYINEKIISPNKT